MSTENRRNRGIRVGGLVFRPMLLPTLLVLVLLALMIRLGLWQLERAEEKRTILAAYEERARQPAEPLGAGSTDTGVLQYRPVYARGHYDVEHQFLLDNRVHNGRAGYEVLTPLRFTHGEGGVLVNRGWIPLGASRSELPAIPTPSGEVRIEGVAKVPTPPVFELEPGEAYAKGWPKVVQQVEPQDMKNMVHYPLLPVMVLLDKGNAHGFVRDWKKVSMSPGKHSSYALQWFGLSTALVILYLVITVRRVRRQGEQ